MKPQTAIVATQTKHAGFDLMNPDNMEAAQKACQLFSKSMLVPEMYRVGGVVKQGESKDAPAVTMTEEQANANVFIALDMAGRMGVNPLMVMQNLYIVKGKPSWSSSFLIATVNTCGRFKPLKFYLSVAKDTNGNPEVVEDKFHNRYVNSTCVAYTCEVNVPEGKEKENMLTSTTISMKMAIDEGWIDKPGSKWKTMPEQMLRYRAAAFWVRTYAPEISMGMYTAEENQEIQDVEYTEVPMNQANKGGQIEMHIPTDPEKPANEPANETQQQPAAKSAKEAMEAAAQQADNNWRAKKNQEGTAEQQPNF